MAGLPTSSAVGSSLGLGGEAQRVTKDSTEVATPANDWPKTKTCKELLSCWTMRHLLALLHTHSQIVGVFFKGRQKTFLRKETTRAWTVQAPDLALGLYEWLFGRQTIPCLYIEGWEEAGKGIGRASHWCCRCTQQSCADQGVSDKVRAWQPNIVGNVGLQEDYDRRDAQRQADLLVKGDMLAQGQQHQECCQIEKEVEVCCQRFDLVRPPAARCAAVAVCPNGEVLSLCDEHIPRKQGRHAQETDDA